MKRVLSLSILTATLLTAQETANLETISVIEEATSQKVTDVSNEQIKSADLAEALTKNIPSISIVRRSGIANDIILRGQKKDNINVLIDDAKLYGACPNRMDPTISHVLSNNIEKIEVIEGPYDVENFGTLSGKVSVETKEPTKDFGGEVNVGVGSFGYKKLSSTVSGGSDKFKVLVSASTESSDQYEDGNGNTFYEQQVEKSLPLANQYINPAQEAYEKKTALIKTIYNIDDSSEVKLSYTANRSENILYPTGTMDADYDDSNIYTVGYTKRDLAPLSKELNLDYYYSNVDHPMSTKLRNNGVTTYTTAKYKTSVWGTKLKNSMEIDDSLVTLGLDTSVRNWKGEKYTTEVATGNLTSGPMTTLYSTDTTNNAVFSKVEKTFGKLALEFGARYDNSDIDTADLNRIDREFDSLNANIFGTYKYDDSTKYFAGIGKSSRVPDARELYSQNMPGTAYVGNQDLDETKNYEIDLGVEKNIGDLNVKTKLFYSKLEDYIYNTGTPITAFQNIDAKIYGAEITGFYVATENLTLNYGLAYQRGQKDGDYTDKDLAEIPPLKANFGLDYEQNETVYTAEVVAVDSWDSYDSSALEQELGGYATVNLKTNSKLSKNFALTLGVDNIFDKTYNSTNTYQDITYATINSERLLFNDPGRYLYANLKYSF